MSAHEFFLEIGTEELPASYIMPAVQELAAVIKEQLSQARITHGDAQIFATPRRLGVVLSDVVGQGEDETQEVMGPPTRVAFDDDGNPRVPAQKFAEKVGLSLDQVERKQTPKGEYLVAQVVEKGESTSVVLARVIPEILSKLSFPKRMRWEVEGRTLFARPVRWLCALLGGEQLNFQFAGLESGTQSYGHRFMAPDAFDVTTYAQFAKDCEARYVIIDPARRKAMIKKQAEDLAASKGGKLWDDPELLDLNTFLVEYPKPLLAGFEKRFLELPPELIRTCVRHHLKSFVVVDEQGKLLPFYVPVSALLSKQEEKVRHGYERVLRARLADAKFFYDEDRSKSLEARADGLDAVLFQAKLGSYGEKVARLRSLVGPVGQLLGLDEHVADAERAAALCKVDLLSGMVYEFPELEGIMGRYYAIHDGESQAVADAIFEHRLPAGQDDDLPAHPAGQILAICERLDTLVGGFAVGMKPTGSADPYGLRRQTIGFLRILQEKELPGHPGAFVELAMAPLAEKIEDPKALKREVLDFIQGRLQAILLREGWERDLVDAVCVRDLLQQHSLAGLHKLLQTLQAAVSSGLLAGIAYSFKRVNNILRAAAKKKLTAAYPGLGALYAREEAPSLDESLLQEETERALHTQYRQVEDKVMVAVQSGDFSTALESLIELRENIDQLFDNVMVMAEDEALRNNRLAPLRGIARLAFLDFSRIKTEDE